MIVLYSPSDELSYHVLLPGYTNTVDSLLDGWREYNEQLFAKPLNEPTLATQDYNVPEPVPLYREVSSAILHLKRRKAPGVDGIPADLIRASGLNAVEALYRLSVKIWRDCSWPDIWKIQEIVILHKGGSPKDCTNYRTIALLSHASKILLLMERGSSVGRMPDSQSREPGFEPRCYRFEVWAFSFTSRRLSRLSCITEYLAIDSGGHVSE